MKQKANKCYKIIDINATISTITLNINSLTFQLKDEDFKTVLKIDLNGFYELHFTYEDTEIKTKRMEKIHHVKLKLSGVQQPG